MKGKKNYVHLVFLAAVLPVFVMVSSCTVNRHPTVDRVPSHAMEEALSFKAPFGDTRTASPEIVAKGKALFEGKAKCVTCHGKNGKGDGPAAHMHKPAPRNFTDCEFQKAREDGELYWIIKYGSPGTGMQAMIPNALTEEEGWDVVAYIRTFCKAQG